MTLTIHRENYDIEIEAKVLHPGYSECRYGHPDNWHPAEGPDLEFEKAWIVRKGLYKAANLNGVLSALDRRSDRWLDEAVEEAVMGE